MALFAYVITRSPAQESTCKGLGRNDQARVITPKATYTPTLKRAGSRSRKKERTPQCPFFPRKGFLKHTLNRFVAIHYSLY
ncbi:hypothetical protein BVJ53_05290 [Lacticaseibacillus chiayiensis]|uniref:Uncharacterized protein n=1 Tax=Lacticaseibacillus chiayiensis TaxID=2100821 RepID=A0A4Q1U6A2_9LACO|nr:hypothetical protein BVJ53_05290 [Lacticaseibacillus chiayiensis]